MPIAVVRPAPHDSAQEGDIVAALFHGNIVIFHAANLLLQLRQLMVMGCKQRLCSKLLFIRHIFQHSPGNAHAVEGGGAPPDLVENQSGCLDVALLRISATSLISTIKVDCPEARSSDAPTRVKMLSAMQMSARCWPARSSRSGP